MQIYGGWNTMLRELNQSVFSAKSRPRTFEKVLPREQGLSEGQILPGTFLDPGSCGGNTPAQSP